MVTQVVPNPRKIREIHRNKIRVIHNRPKCVPQTATKLTCNKVNQLFHHRRYPSDYNILFSRPPVLTTNHHSWLRLQQLVAIWRAACNVFCTQIISIQLHLSRVHSHTTSYTIKLSTQEILHPGAPHLPGRVSDENQCRSG